MDRLSAFTRLVALPENCSAFHAAERLLQQLMVNDHADPSGILLMLHGPSGTGKTALIDALVDECSVLGGLATCVRSAEQLHGGDVAAHLEALEHSGLCVVEDLQHLPPSADESLVQLIDARLRDGASMVVTALTGPRDLCRRDEPLSLRLRSRLAGGLVVGLEPWQRQSRLAFLQEMARRRDRTVPDPVLVWLATHLSVNGRQLDAALTQIDCLQQLLGQPLSLEQVQEHFQAAFDSQRPSVDRIAEHVGRYYRQPPRDLTSTRRQRRLVLPRQVSMYLARCLTRMSLQQIGAFFGGRDHTTVLHACRSVETALETDVALAGAVRRLTAELA